MIHMGYVSCRGDETKLLDCQSSFSRSGCSHSYDLGIRCKVTGVHTHSVAGNLSQEKVSPNSPLGLVVKI